MNERSETFKAWVRAARPRTLPLSVSGILVGTALAIEAGAFDLVLFILALLTTIAFQVLSNFANDYGDGIKGTDSDDRIGPARALQSGALDAKALKRGIQITVVLCILLVLSVLWRAFGVEKWTYTLLFLGLGILSIIGAIKYTMGDRPYGYSGLGDLSVFLFFGLLAVLGTRFLFLQEFDILALLPAVTVGSLSMAVLNLNNMRDLESDRTHGKITLAVRLGRSRAKIYHMVLFLFAGLALVAYIFWAGWGGAAVLPVLIFLSFISHLRKVWGSEDPKSLDPELKKVALGTFFLSVSFLIVVNYF